MNKKSRTHGTLMEGGKNGSNGGGGSNSTELNMAIKKVNSKTSSKSNNNNNHTTVVPMNPVTNGISSSDPNKMVKSLDDLKA